MSSISWLSVSQEYPTELKLFNWALVALSLLLISGPYRDRSYLYLITFLGFYLTRSLMEQPFSDQYLAYQVLKPIDLLSDFPLRPLYSHFRDFPENYVRLQGTGEAIKYWEYPYLPLTAVLSFLHLPFGFDPRIIYALLYSLSILANAQFIQKEKRWILLAIAFATPAPFILGVCSLSTTALVPLSYFLLRLGMYYQGSTLIAAAILACSQLFHQSTWVLYGFCCLLLATQKKLAPALISGLLVLLCLTYFAFPFPEAFYHNAIYQHLGFTDAEVFKVRKSFNPWTLSALVESLSNLSAEEIYQLLPRKTLQLVAILAFFSYWLFSAKSKEQTIRVATLLSLAIMFISRTAWSDSRYFLAPAVVAFFPDAFVQIDQQVITRLKKFLLSGGVLLICCTLFAKNLLLEQLSWGVGEMRNYQIALPSEGERFSLSNGAGYLASDQRGLQYWILLPPGKYSIFATAKNKETWKGEVIISEERSFGLRLALEIFSRGNTLLYSPLPNSDVGFMRKNLVGVSIDRMQITKTT
ncbi:hypothetical protein JNK13_06775 [bacterium]|nr:hypothetical protein [bacterium]